jgi:hypothetical protein
MAASINQELTGRDVFVKVTDTKTGAVIATQHRAWDVDRFMASQQQQYRDADAKEKPPTPGRHVVTMIDRTEYQTISRRAAA